MPPPPAAGTAPVPDLGLAGLGAVPPHLLPGESDFAAALVRFAPAETVPRTELAAFFALRSGDVLRAAAGLGPIPDKAAALRRTDRYGALRATLADFAPAAMDGVPVPNEATPVVLLPPYGQASGRATQRPRYGCLLCDRSAPGGHQLCEQCDGFVVLLTVEREASRALGLALSPLHNCIVCGTTIDPPDPAGMVCSHQQCYDTSVVINTDLQSVARVRRVPDWSPPPGQTYLLAPPHDGRPFACAFAEALHSAAADRHLAPEPRTAVPDLGPDDALLTDLQAQLDPLEVGVPSVLLDPDSAASPPGTEDVPDSVPPRTATVLAMPRSTRGHAALADALTTVGAVRDSAAQASGAVVGKRYAMVAEAIAAVAESAAFFEQAGYAVAPLPYRGLGREHVTLEGFRAHLADVPDVRVTASVRPLGGLRTVHGTGISEPPSERFAMYRLELRDEAGVDIHEVQLEVAPGPPAPVYLWHRESAGRVPRDDGTVARPGDRPLPVLSAGTDLPDALDVFACDFAAWVRYLTRRLEPRLLPTCVA